MGRRIDIKPDDVAYLGRERRVFGELEGADAVRLKPVRAPDALDLGETDAPSLRHRPAGPLGGFAGGSASVRAIMRSATSGPNGAIRDGRVLS
jgi:hypothetical protein